MKRKTLQFNTLSEAEFLAEYWQKKPVLIKQGLANFSSPLSRDEVAGLALEEEIESRLIWEKHPKTSAPWALEHGPMQETQLQQLPTSGWTLLIQGVDQWIPEVADLIDYFHFIPRWRFEDVMISLAPQGGSVGPHVDQYDVFLCQAEGQRLWQWSLNCDHQLQLRDDTALNILNQPLPEPTASAVLDPGDVLYLPPGFAHHGIAQSFSQTWSVGFRAPDAEDLFSALAHRISLEPDASALRYGDPDLTVSEAQSAELSQHALDRARHLLSSCLTRPELIADILGALVTRPALQNQQWDTTDSPAPPPHPKNEVIWRLGVRRTHHANRLYINGASYVLPEVETPLIQGLMNLEFCPWGELIKMAQTKAGRAVLDRLWELQLLIAMDEA